MSDPNVAEGLHARVVLSRKQFRDWATEQGLPLTPAPNMECADGKFPACYLNPVTEGAWRAWANKDSWLERNKGNYNECE